MSDSQRGLPEDNVYNWAAFNKLLLLGMYAPVEEAHAGKQHTQLVVQQLQIIAGAREVCATRGACDGCCIPAQHVLLAHYLYMLLTAMTTD